MIPYLERVKPRRHHVRPHLLPVDYIASELGVATHGARSRTLVEALVDVLGGQRQLAESPRHLEDLSGFAAAGHLVGCMRGLVVRRVVLCRYRINGGRVHRFIFRSWAGRRRRIELMTGRGSAPRLIHWWLIDNGLTVEMQGSRGAVTVGKLQLCTPPTGRQKKVGRPPKSSWSGILNVVQLLHI